MMKDLVLTTDVPEYYVDQGRSEHHKQCVVVHYHVSQISDKG